MGGSCRGALLLLQVLLQLLVVRVVVMVMYLGWVPVLITERWTRRVQATDLMLLLLLLLLRLLVGLRGGVGLQQLQATEWQQWGSRSG